jgi:putative FmdB family regulatory protein
MPIYEYRCTDCQTTFEILVRGDNGVACPDCGSQRLDKLITAASMLSGQTKRAPGSTCCGLEERCDAPPCSEGGNCWRD